MKARSRPQGRSSPHDRGRRLACDKRIATLEAAAPQSGGTFDLDALSGAELERLEAILLRWRPDENVPLPVDQMPDDDLRFLASLLLPPV